MTEDLIVRSRVIGTVEKRKDVIGELTVIVSPYDEFYNNNDIVISEAKNPILILVSKNSGGGIAENVCVKAVTIFTKSGKVELSSEKMLFSCSAGETVATRIYANIDEEEIQKVEIKIGYTDILGNLYLLTSIFEMQNNRKAEMKLLDTTREVKHR
ncbi:MAG: hypothetical protein LUH23_06215 [Oscillospiraceae bacterium]|nr:hypothetical protein [Oscillospiraceae bacterium]